MKQVALIGVSGYGTIYLREYRNLLQQGKIQLAGVVIRNPDKARETYEQLAAEGVPIFSSDAAMYEQLAGKIDLVGIPTAIHCHEAMTTRALEAGASVLLEKPVAGSLAEVDRMIDTAKRHPKQFVAIGFQHTYGAEFQMLQERILKGDFGRVNRITIIGAWPRNDFYYHRNNWAGKKFTADGTPVWDSPINNAFAHFLNIALFLCSQERGKSALGTLLNAELWRVRQDIETFDNCTLEVEANGAKIRAFFTHTCRENFQPVIRVECANATIEWQMNGELQIADTAGNVLEHATYPEPHSAMFNNVIARLDDPSAFIYTLESARNHTAIVEDLKQVPINDVEPSLVERRESDGQYVAESMLEQARREWSM